MYPITLRMEARVVNPERFDPQSTTYKIKVVDGVEQGFAISRWHGSERATKVAVVSRIKRRDLDGVYAVTFVVPDKNERLGRMSKSGTYARCKSWDEAEALFAEEVAKFEQAHGAFPPAIHCPTCTCGQPA